MAISRKRHIARERYFCDKCSKAIEPKTFYHRVFGMSAFTQMPYEAFFHPDCGPKIKK